MSVQDEQLAAIRFQLAAIGRIDELLGTELYAHVDRTSIDQVLEQAAAFAEQELTPLARFGDYAGCVLQDGLVKLPRGTDRAFRIWQESGAVLLDLPTTQGGLGFPRVVLNGYQELCDGANLSFGMLQTGQRGAARLLLAHGAGRLPPTCIDNVVNGAWASTISISEPQAGSDVGRIRTRAEPAGAGRWRIFGSKCWISYGGHDLTEQIIHMVLARMPGGEPGTRGLGLFAMGSQRMDDQGRLLGPNGVTVAGLEHKMGLHASPTCVMQYDGAEAVLLGEPGRGLAAMFTMVNSMRLGVAVQGVATAAAATAWARAYATERLQGGPPEQAPLAIIEHIDVKRMLLEMYARTETTRALVFRIAWLLDRHQVASNDAAARYHQLADFLLPVAKTWAAETGFAVASQAIQVLGGAGYTRDHPVERIARDIRIAAIFEGTSGIQSLDLVMRKLAAGNGSAAASLIEEIGRSIAAAGTDHPYAEVLPKLIDEFRKLSDELLRAVRERPADAQAGAYAYLQFTGILVTSWCGMDLYLHATDTSTLQCRLRAALSWHAARVAMDACCWAEQVRAGARHVEIATDLFL
ncbi:MAG: acyl-CoA dehydrogenase family protein [Gammaproteobacteria bacterium]|nr:acyl-CoA dehydrogenase family protein [Gammaproteobacteria bacterium]